jgi:hypothetical protein
VQVGVGVATGGALFVLGILERLSVDSARTKNTIVNMTASQKIGRAAFDLFMLLLLLLSTCFYLRAR